MDKQQRKLALVMKQSLKDVLVDHDLASLGDAYINFVYSLALSSRRCRPTGVKVKGRVLAEALKKADLRKYLPSGISQHDMADAAEALIVYAWLQRYLAIDEMVSFLQRSEDSAAGLSQLLLAIVKKVKPSEGLSQAPC